MLTPRLLLIAALLFVLAVNHLQAQPAPSRIFSNPALPSEEALRRLNLRLAWTAAVPVDGRKDGLLLIQPVGADLFVLTRAGLVIRINAETGQIYWRTLVDRPYSTLPFMTFNSRTVYVIANASMHALDRQRGNRIWEIPLSGGTAVAPVVDEERAYTSLADTRLNAYTLPRTDLGISEVRRIATTRGDRELITRPFILWSKLTYLPLSYQPILSANRLFTITESGEGLGLRKRLADRGTNSEVYRFTTEGRVLVPPIGYGETAYIGTNNGILYSLDMESGRTNWRYMAGSNIVHRPVAIDADLYVTSQDEGLARINRAIGEPEWFIPKGRTRVHGVMLADRFLAANHRFVYATDHANRLLVIDRKRGTILSHYDASRFRFPVVNSATDRLYLAANSGLILCLHDPDQPDPIHHRQGLAKEVRARLSQQVVESGVQQISIAEYLGMLSAKYEVQFRMSDEAFKAAGIPNPRDVVINVEPGNRTIQELINRALRSVPAHMEIDEDTIVILPGKDPTPEKKDPPVKKPVVPKDPEDPDNDSAGSGS